MKYSKLILATAMAAVAFASASAQRMMMMGGGMGMSKLSVLMAPMRFGGGGGGGGGATGGGLRADVSKELAVTDEQKGKIEAFNTKQREEMMALFQSGERPSQEQMQELGKKRTEAEAKLLKDTFTEKQLARLTELWVQRLGNGAVAVPELQKALKMTDAQIEKVKTLQTKQQEANASIFEKMQNGEIDRSEIRPLMEKNNKALTEEYGKILTDEQKESLKKLGGTPFKFDEDN